jgi:hypothetical protein
MNIALLEQHIAGSYRRVNLSSVTALSSNFLSTCSPNGDSSIESAATVT